MDQAKKQQLIDIIRQRSFKTGEFTLASGKKSNFYFNLKTTMCHPVGGKLIGELMLDIIKENKLKPDAIGGMELGALPITFHLQAIAMQHGVPLNAFIVRKQAKDHGTQSRLEGIIEPNSKVIIIEDVTTTGTSALQSMEVVQQEVKSQILAVFTVLDRMEGSQELFASKKIPFYSLVQKKDFGV